MKKNMSSFDGFIRAMIAALIAVLYHFKVISGVFALALLAIAVIFILTSLSSRCPLYFLFRINTRKRSSN